MIPALNLYAPEWWAPPGQADGAEPTRFKIRGLDGVEQSEIAPEVTIQENGDLVISARGVARILAAGLLDWSNYSNDRGPVDFDPSNPPANQRAMAYQTQMDVAVEILSRSFIGAEVKKKSE